MSRSVDITDGMTGIDLPISARRDKLDGHLLPGLQTNGVPRNLKDTALSFHYNDFDELEEIVKNKNIGAIKMEVERKQWASR